jgi:hypothetical protein
MAVTITWIEWNSSDTPGNNVGTAASNLNLGNTDARDLTPASYPIAAGSLSYHKNIKINVSGSYTQISNGKLYKSAGAYVTEEIMTFSGSKAWVTPATDDTADPDIPTSLPSANVILSGGTTDGILPRNGESESSPGYYSGSRTDLVNFQLETGSSTPAGAVNTKTISFTYDRQ